MVKLTRSRVIFTISRFATSTARRLSVVSYKSRVRKRDEKGSSDGVALPVGKVLLSRSFFFFYLLIYLFFLFVSSKGRRGSNKIETQRDSMTSCPKFELTHERLGSLKTLV